MHHDNKNKLSGNLGRSERSRKQAQPCEWLVLGFAWVMHNAHVHIMNDFGHSVLTNSLTICSSVSLQKFKACSVNKCFSHFAANWNHLLIFKNCRGVAPILHTLISWHGAPRKHQETSRSSPAESNVQPNLGNSWQGFSASVFSDLVWRDADVLSHT